MKQLILILGLLSILDECYCLRKCCNFGDGLYKNYGPWTCVKGHRKQENRQPKSFLNRTPEGLGFPICRVPRSFRVPYQALDPHTDELKVEVNRQKLIIPKQQYCIDGVLGENRLVAVVCNTLVEAGLAQMDQDSHRQGRNREIVENERTNNLPIGRNRRIDNLRRQGRGQVVDGIKEMFSNMANDVFNLKQSADATLRRIGQGIGNIVSLEMIANNVVNTVGEELDRFDRSTENIQLDDLVGRIVTKVAKNVISNVTTKVAQRRDSADDTELKIYENIEQLMPIIGDVLQKNVNKGLQNLQLNANAIDFDDAFQQMIPSVALDVMKNVNAVVGDMTIDSPDGNPMKLGDVFKKMLPVVALDVMSTIQRELKRATNPNANNQFLYDKIDYDEVFYDTYDTADSSVDDVQSGLIEVPTNNLNINDNSDDLHSDDSDDVDYETDELLTLIEETYYPDEVQNGNTDIDSSDKNSLETKSGLSEEDVESLNRLIRAQNDFGNNGNKMTILDPLLLSFCVIFML